MRSRVSAGGLGRSAVGAHHDQAEILLPGRLGQLIQQRFDLAIQVQGHLLHERREGAGFVSQEPGGTGQDAQKLEGGALAQLCRGR